MLGLGKEVKEMQKAQGKGINSRSHFVLVIKTLRELKALVWFWLIDKTISANLVYPSDEAMVKIMMMVMAW